ncbi:hypothetical protein CpB0032 [Chlamydia pneumoniae TW-183]|uniref:Uncharacterized protein n=2 Tax=Chlamydia pneumoniae TaxID=83558 RepID=Q9Z9F3_CHLPN|nr:DUF648 domain-containing protein [Chlamydia pneumoniae]AAD18181.1 hypothetical protein CPn_0028 [Chlamydia pneumoniae CWL029]AAF38553.1 hypothetical protein CP_0748 [Chlamydia pneumoniae AR39]AAP97965.1 hypothetical protein CpB0032 [Chlamydia pneumoniae TW-183]ACZ33001.1 hypothetical protein CPK_ORF00530 [Chlamydia pneumoniae LPCoLN]ETR79897.1 hypothetical protein X556_0775 [Chlamydia pneumoniae B21]
MFLQFFHPIVFSDQSLSFLPYLGKSSGIIEKCSNIVEHYLHLGGDTSVIITGVSGATFLSVDHALPISKSEKIIKILSYILILPLILALFIKIVLRIILFFKYRGLILDVKKEDLKKTLTPDQENLSLPLPSPTTLKKIHALHILVRSGKTYNELIQEGFSFTKITDLGQAPSPKQDIGFSYNSLLPNFYFHSLVSVPNISGEERALNYHKEQQEEMAVKLKTMQACSFVFRSLHLPSMQTKDKKAGFGLLTFFPWKIYPL